LLLPLVFELRFVFVFYSIFVGFFNIKFIHFSFAGL